MLFSKMLDEEGNSDTSKSSFGSKSKKSDSFCESPATIELGKESKEEIDTSPPTCDETQKRSSRISLKGPRNLTSPLSSLEILTNNPICNYKSAGKSTSESSNSSSYSPNFSPISPQPLIGPNNANSAQHFHMPSPTVSPYNCDLKLFSFYHRNNSELLYPYHDRDHDGRYFMPALAPVPQKVPCIVVASFSSPGASNSSTPMPDESLNNNETSDDCSRNKNIFDLSKKNENEILNYSKLKLSKVVSEKIAMSPSSSSSSSCCDNAWNPSPKLDEDEDAKSKNRNLKNEDFTGTTSTSSKSNKLTFGMDRILSQDQKNLPKKENDYHQPKPINIYSPHSLHSLSSSSTTHQFMKSLQNQHYHNSPSSTSFTSASTNCTECLLLSKFGYKMPLAGNSREGSGLPMPIIPSNYPTNNYGPILPQVIGSPWLHHHNHSTLYDSSSLISSNGYGHSNLPSSYGLGASNYSSMSSMVACNTNGSGRRKRSWSRAVFSNLQRKGLEKRFQMQKYITKPDRRQLAAMLGLTDAQVKVWFQNRRMKWRHTKEGKCGSNEHSSVNNSSSGTSNGTKDKSKSLNNPTSSLLK